MFDHLLKNTDVEHEEQVGSTITRGFFWPKFVKLGDPVNLTIESKNIAGGVQVEIEIFPEDEPGTTAKKVNGKLNSSGTTMINTKIDFPAKFLEPLRYRVFRFRAKVTQKGYNVVFDRSDNALAVGEMGVVIESLNERFAPKAEILQLHYKFADPDKMIKGAKLRIYGSHYDGKNYPDKGAVVYEETIPPNRRLHNTSVQWAWSGRTNTKAGPLKADAKRMKYINPLFSPYIVEIIFSTKNADPDKDNAASKSYLRKLKDGSEIRWQTKVEIHSVILEPGEFVPADKIPKQKTEKDKWAQYRMNVLGYPCGPVDGNIGDMTKRAIKNFQRANWRVPWPDDLKTRVPLSADALVGIYTTNALASEQVEKREWFSSRDFSNPNSQIRLYVWTNVFYQYQTDIENGKREWDKANTDEFGNVAKHEKENQNLVRPWIPIRAKIKIKNRAGAAQFVPEAVGEIRVNFSFTDPEEDLTVTSNDVNYQPRKYINSARHEKDHVTGDNCPTDYAGARDVAEAENYKKHFHIGTELEPYESKDDSANHQIYVSTPIEGECQGTAAVFFIPSFKGGDNYKLKAQLDFTGNPNLANIQPGQPISIESPTFTIWRKMKVAAYLRFCQTTDPPHGYATLQAAINAARQKYSKAFIEYEQPGFIGSVSEFLSEEEYKKLMYKLEGLTTKAQKDRVKYRPAVSIFPYDVPSQGSGGTPKDPLLYRNSLLVTASHFCSKAYEPLGQVIVNNVRKRFREGNVIIEYQAHPAVNINRTAIIFGLEVVIPLVYAERNYISCTSSIGLCAGLVFLQTVSIQSQHKDFAYLLAHEMGHTGLMYHWENASTTTLTVPANYEDPANFRQRLDDHDHKDTNCIMSYCITNGMIPDPGPADPVWGGKTRWDFIEHVKKTPAHTKYNQVPERYRPNFCGKCLLKLRGWDVTTLPRSY